MKYKYHIILALFMISLISAFILSFEPMSLICAPGQGCTVVHNSSYNYTLGIQNSYYGVVIFAIMMLIVLSHLKKPTVKKGKIIDFGIIIGSLIVIYFLYIQQFILHAYCKYCLVVDFSLLIALIIVFVSWRKK